MARRVRTLHRMISVPMVGLANCEILRIEFDDMIKKMPDAQMVELVLVEHYDDGESEVTQ